MKFYPSDWRSEPTLRLCSIAARGLWAEMMCVMHDAEPYGSLLVNGRRIDKKQLAGLAAITEKDCTTLLMELEGNGVFSRDDDGTIYSRRMRRDHAKAIKDKENGKGGGNPGLKGKVKGGVNPPDKGEDKAQKPEARIDVADDARANPNPSFDLAERLLVIAGHDRSFWPPGWCGAPNRIATWLAQGWKPEIIIAAVTSAAARKRGPPANSVQFFENAIAEEHARQAAPLPQVEIRDAPTLTVTRHGKPKSAVIQAIDDLNQRIADFDDLGGSDELRGSEGQAPPRLLSHG
ncbi:hypothetical protein IVB46_02630 [Bradyrhizobium sp. 61]|uniref:hypothetical protein n=1 Tax=Bradyrhizobium sp. 61 TaxID=2782679 RepID=UPI001FF8BA29|nr:hypothetical protein [Bradyrhizobium sp. 61]MCK1274136.1 hypothetical protein [Bradyrhizobium sp. 61]